MTSKQKSSSTDGLPRGEVGRLHWTLGKNDPRTPRGEERRELLKVGILGLAIYLIFGLVVWTVIGPSERWRLVALFMGVWAVAGAVLLAALLHRRRIAVEVLTIVRLPPGETDRRLGEALARAGVRHERVDRTPWLHGEEARFRVRMGGAEALLVVALWFQSDEGPTKIILRSSRRRVGWHDLRSVVEEAFSDVAVEAPVEKGGTTGGDS